ncbi:asparagine synthase [Xylariales sp. AK1849]|nr:asparagine synthase [Xylariales sp. AK1849]
MEGYDPPPGWFTCTGGCGLGDATGSTSQLDYNVTFSDVKTMCGIYAVVSANKNIEIPQSLKQALLSRGPDYLGQATRSVTRDDAQDSVSITFTSTVLALRGDHVARQPFQDPCSRSVLCWNGEAWKIGAQTVDGNDGEAIFAKLINSPSADVGQRENHILTVLRSIQGPFAFLFYDAPGKCLYFGRDRLGRRSLLINQAEEDRRITFSSIADSLSNGWVEVEADGVHSMHLVSHTATSLHISKHGWLPSGEAGLVSSIGKFNTTVPEGGEMLDFATPSVNLIRDCLTESLKLRILNIPEPPTTPDPQSDIDIRIAVLFSGGLDCTILARLADEFLPTSQGIDLVNVAFQNARDVASHPEGADAKASLAYEACPDRVTGRKAFAELRAACPSRYWRFIAINVPYAETMAHRSRVVSLIYPHNTEMDLSIALALYFASRGMGDSYTDHANFDPSAPSVTTPARVLVSGLGADELFGGYSRHESAFKRRGYSGLIDELKLDVSRIGERNLGRDDRVLSHWGKEVRFPYLDEEFMRFAMGTPVWEKCDFGNQFHPAVIEPAKRVLRLLADQLNLPSTAREKKRAIQFGARTAKLERTIGGARVRGTDVITQPPNPQ